MQSKTGTSIQGRSNQSITGAFVDNVPMAQTPRAGVITDRMQYSTHESVNSTNDGASRPSAGNG